MFSLISQILLRTVLPVVLVAALPAQVGVSQDAPGPSAPANPAANAPGAASAPAETKPAAPVEPAAAPDAFVLGPEDMIYIRVMHEPDLTGPQDVRPDGMIVMQLIGELKAAGRTPAQLAADIRAKLLETMRNPEVTVQLTKVNSRKFTIQGEVNRPGTYTFAAPVTVLEALVNGQGFRDFANVKKIYILRNGQRLRFNYKDVSHGKHMEANVIVQNGDQIFVP